MGSEFTHHQFQTDPLERLAQDFLSIVRTQAQKTNDRSHCQSTPYPISNVELAQKIIKERRQRDRWLGADLFGEPVWDMLIDLFISAETQRRVGTSSLCIASGVPATTALRHLAAMEKRGMIVRHPDPHDNRRVFIKLVDEWHSKVDQLLTSWRSAGGGGS